MTNLSKLWFLVMVSALAASATTISFVGPTTPAGVPCMASDPTCVFGGAPYAIYGLQLTQPTASNLPWTLTIETNYPAVIPTPGNVIPPAIWGVDLQPYSISDLLINWNGHDYGIVLAQHDKAGNTMVDSYQAGNLYQSVNDQLSNEILSGLNPGNPTGVLPGSPRPNEPVWLAPGGTLLGTGTVSVVAGGNGTPAMYTITDKFFAPAGFLSTGSFNIIDSSYTCANGLIVGGGTFTGGTGGGVPEPGTFWLSLPAALFLLWRYRTARKQRAERLVL